MSLGSCEAWAAFGTAAVWTTCLLAGELFSTPVGIIAALFVGSSYWHLMISRMGTRAVAAPFFFTLSLFLLLRGLKSQIVDRKTLGWLIAAGAAYGAGFHTYTAFRITPAIVGGLLLVHLWKARRNGTLKPAMERVAVFAVTALIVVAPLAWYFIQYPDNFAGRASQVSVFHRSSHPALEIAGNTWKTAMMFFVAGDTSWRHNIPGRPELYFPVAVLFALGIVIAVGKVWRRPQDVFPYGIVLAWLAVAAVPAILSGEGIPHALRSVLMIPAAAILAALGALQSWRFLESRLF